MISNTIATLIVRDLNKLRNEIEAYKIESSMWVVPEGIANAGGNLCLHLIGNLNTYIGRDLGGIEYLRDRPLEFSAKNVPRDRLISGIEDTLQRISQTLNPSLDAKMNEDFPYVVLDKPYTILYMLVHLSGHLNYHLGQINYHRRMVEGSEHLLSE